ncbi:MAG TPA: UDP-N-acetylmuramoyl-tripeptide--D-alanyl-D-alanine ligase [Bryobacteraceae bacterium]|nr:UDP-N-acetylmuramoyl-tripeptide--D-alanyl-D-alanine ligase [Bryobacteraceae bacterium]
MKLSLNTIARVVGAEAPVDLDVSGYSIDTRTLEPGDLFFALRGENHDGHDYVHAAFDKGANSAVVDRDIPGLPVVRVADSLKALQVLGAWARQQWDQPVVGVTGSAGKTSTKDVIASLLSVALNTGRTVGNYNNHIGVPLSILRLPDEAEVAVLELGMNHAGELRDLARIAKPEIGVVTNVGYAHVEFFESVDAVAAAKRELVESLPQEGVAVLNADDPRVARMGEVHPGRTVLFGLSENAAVRAQDVEFSETGVRFRACGTRFESPLAGTHGVRNILAGIAVARVFGIAPAQLRDAVSALAPGRMRGERIVHKGITIINDSYNSNPDAVRSMLDVLRNLPARRKIAVLGEMLELGRWAEPLHREIGRYVAECGISVLVGIRGAAQYMVEAARNAGHAVDAAYFFDDPTEAGAALAGVAQAGDAVLFKGSRGTRVERALEAFLDKVP